MSTSVADTAKGAAGGHETAARAVSLVKTYGMGEARVVALDGVDVSIGRGRFTAVMGPSGSGKSTLMHCLAGLDTVSAGRVWLGEREITGLNDRQLTRLRRDHVGFMFQSFNLLPTLTAEENITLPMDIAGRKPDREWLREVISTLRLGDRLRHRPSQLSGGQQQRVACARALAARPDLIFADEPTGNLDSRSGLEVLQFLREAVDGLGQTVVMVTHDPNAAAHADRALYLADGRIVDEMARPTAESVLERMQIFATGPKAAQPLPATGAGPSPNADSNPAPDPDPDSDSDSEPPTAPRPATDPPTGPASSPDAPRNG
ncbi:ABC transporter ATP-binding protein [Streptomyces rimosus]|uniref:ABC transporter ATP-binding protein n=1 Tax=Streptomyces rimosus TaxID=1927 RepID=UPI0004CB6B01